MLIVSNTELGTPEDVWSSAPALQDLAALVPERRPLVVVAPHPDDEVLGAGGLMIAAHRLGSAITIVAVTDGEASHPGTSWTGARLAARRRAESDAALDHLGTGMVDVVRCAIPDGEVARHEDLLSRRVLDVIDPTSLVVTTWRHDGHPDHEATGRAAAAAAGRVGAAVLEFPIWAWHWATPSSGLPLHRARRLDLSPADAEAKRRAIAAFTSQITPLGEGPEERPILPPPIRARFERPFEVHLVGPPR